MSLKMEFVMLARSGAANVRQLCRRFGISAKTGYKWLNRFAAAGKAGLMDRSRRPRHSPSSTAPQLQEQVCQMRTQHPAWGGRKIHARLVTLGNRAVPAASTISDILRRHGMIKAEESSKHTAFRRFEHEHPNDLWQMDFMGHFPLDHGRCHTLTVLDDYSRFCVGAKACGDETALTVQAHLTTLFRRFGLPRRILSDNGPPWGCPSGHRYTRLSAWLIRLGIGIAHGRPAHPQTQGKDERFHRTLRAELVNGRRFADLMEVQRCFDPWREMYNLERPHEALELKPPISRYTASTRVFPEVLPPIEYAAEDVVRSINKDGYFSYRATRYKISQAFTGHRVALRPTSEDGIIKVFFCHQNVATIDLKQPIRI